MNFQRSIAGVASLAVIFLVAACATEGTTPTASTDLVGGEIGPPAEEGSAAPEAGAGQPAPTGQAAAAGAPATGAQQTANAAQAGSAPAQSSATKLVTGVPVKLQPVSRIAPQTAAAGAVLPRPGSATYRCNGGRKMLVDNRRSSVVLQDPDGEVMVLPAAPAGQFNRYGKKPYALVLEGGEALYVKPRKSPFTCKR